MAPNGRDGRLHRVGRRRGVETAVPAVIALPPSVTEALLCIRACERGFCQGMCMVMHLRL